MMIACPFAFSILPKRSAPNVAQRAPPAHPLKMNRLRAIRDQLAAPALAPVDGATAAATVPTTNDHDHDDVDLEARTLAHREQQARAHLSELSALLVEQASNIKDAHAAAEWVKALVELHACSGDATVAVNEQSPLYVDFVRILLSFFRECPHLRVDGAEPKGIGWGGAVDRVLACSRRITCYEHECAHAAFSPRALALETVLSLLHRLLFDTAASPIVTKETILTLSVFYNHCTRNHLALPSASILNVVLPTLFEKESGSLPAIPFDAHLGVFAACIRYLQSCITAETDPSSSRSRPPASLGLGTSAAAYTLQRKRHELWSALLKTIRILWKAQAPQGSARLTAYINIVFPILRSDPKLYMDEAYRLYVELIVVELSSIRRNAQGQALMNGMKTVKNGMVAILR